MNNILFCLMRFGFGTYFAHDITALEMINCCMLFNVFDEKNEVIHTYILIVSDIPQYILQNISYIFH